MLRAIIRDLYNLETTEFLLPVDLVHFSAQKQAKAILLDWSSAQEINAAKYILEKQTNGGHFRTISEQMAAGTSSERQHYSFLDQQPTAGENIYRLKMVDLDGSWTYSEAKSVYWGENWLKSVQISPNPAQNWLEVATKGADEMVNYQIFDELGRTWRTGNWWATSEKERISLENLPKGLLFLEISTKNESQVLRFYSN